MKTTLEEKLFNILTDYGDFFLTDYPTQAETKSIHPTIEKITKLFSQEKLSLLQRIEEEVIGENDTPEEYMPKALTESLLSMAHYAVQFHARNTLRQEMRLALEKIKKEYE